MDAETTPAADEDFTIELPWPAADATDEEDDDAPPAAPRLPHELDELLGEFVDVLYGSRPSHEGEAPAADEPADGPVSVDGSVASLPPSSPASLSADTFGWASEEDKRQGSGSSSPVGEVQPAASSQHLSQRRGVPPSLVQEHPALPVPLPAPSSDEPCEPIGPTTCWGALFKGHTRGCEAGFCIGKAHFKNKFCARCRERIDVPLCAVRALTPALREAYTNPLSEVRAAVALHWNPQRGPPEPSGPTV
jgi:hypothetical protein